MAAGAKCGALEAVNGLSIDRHEESIRSVHSLQKADATEDWLNHVNWAFVIGR